MEYNKFKINRKYLELLQNVQTHVDINLITSADALSVYIVITLFLKHNKDKVNLI
jgi:hypothetical protein